MVHTDKLQCMNFRWLIAALIPILIFISGDLFAGWYPDAITDFSGGATYCQVLPAGVGSPLSVTFTACKSGGGQQSDITVNWYESGAPGTPVQSDVSTTAVKTYIFTPPINVVGTLTYYVEIVHPGGACAPANPLITGNQVVIVKAPPTASNAGPNQPISIDNALLAGNDPADGIGTWTTPGGATITDDLLFNTAVTNLDVGANVFRWTIVNNNPPCADDWSEVTITYTPAADDCPDETLLDIDGGETVCQPGPASQLTATINTSGGTGTPTLQYQWYYNTTPSSDPVGATRVGLDQDTYLPPSGLGEVGTTRYYFCVGYAVDNGCGQDDETGPATLTQQMVEIIDVPATPGAFTAEPTPVVASTGGLVYTVPTVPMATQYNWTLPTGNWVGASATESITATSGPTPGVDNGVFTVEAENSCDVSVGVSTSTNIVVTGPDCPDETLLDIDGGETVCQPGPASQLTATINTSGGTGTPTLQYQWYYNTTPSSDPLSATRVGLDQDTYMPPSSLGEVGTTRYYFCVGYAVDNGCGQDDETGPATLTRQMVKIIDVPVDPDDPTGPLTPSTGASGLVYTTNTVASADFYTWVVPANWVINSGGTTTAMTATAGGVFDDGPITVTATNSCGPSTGAGSLVVDVTPLSDHTATQCASCHTFHNAPGAQLGSGTGNYLICVGCHAGGQMAAALPFTLSMKADIPGGTGNSHNWDVAADNPTYEAQMPQDPVLNQWATSAGDKVGCSVCHDQHDDGAYKYLRMVNTNDEMCKDCHRKRDVQRYQDDILNKGSHPVGIVYPDPDANFNNPPSDSKILTPGGNVQCSSCHGIHDVDGALGLTDDGKLLRIDVVDGNDLCMNCHIMPTHQGFDCLTCHQVHNNTKDNIYMIRDIVNDGADHDVVFTAQSGPGSYVDKVVGNDGICEVCHDGLNNHNSDGSEIFHDDATDKRETKCTACHKHTDAFTAPLIVSCVGCHSSSQGPIPQIVDPGGEFDQPTGSTHSAIDPVAEDCEMCHYEAVGDHPVTNMELRDIGSDAVFVGNKNVYCVLCHDQDAPTSPQDYSYINTPLYNKSTFIGTPHDIDQNSCMQCHNRHGSANSALLTAGTNYEVCLFCHDGSNSSKIILEANIAVPGTIGNTHAFNIDADIDTYETDPPSDPTMSARLDGSGNIVCSTCHNPHKNDNTKFLARSNTDDFMCKDCHHLRDRGRYIDNMGANKGTHPVGLDYIAGGDFKAAPTQSATQVGPVGVGVKVECSSCHIVHISQVNDGNLLRQTNDNVLCTDCHNLSTHIGNGCLTCHTVHNELNKDNIMLIGDFANFTQRTGANSFADGDANYTAVCEVCHNAQKQAYFVDLKRAIPGSQGTSHNWDVAAFQPARGAQLPSNTEMADRIYDGNIVCVTCHNQHSDAFPPSLRISNANDNMCKDCHAPRALGRYIDDMGANIGSHPVGLGNPGAPDFDVSPTNLSYIGTGPTVECSSCHGVHDVAEVVLTDDGNLLKMPNTSALCDDCHNYQTHQGFDCLDCHQPHGGTNIMLIRSQIDIDVTAGVNLKDVIFNSQGSDAPVQPQFAPKSFSDGDGVRDGICEVCHHQANVANHSGDFDDAKNHYDGQKCTGCHFHNDATASFPKPSCHDCHERDFPGETQEFPATGAHAKHAGAQYEFKCSECHWGAGNNSTTDPIWPGEAGHNNGSFNVIFNPTGLASRGGLDLPSASPPNWAGATPSYDGGTKTCSNIYCHSTGESAYRGQDVDDTWGGKGPFGSEQPTYTNPVWTATITACTSCHGGKGNMTSPYTIDMGSPNAHLILDYGTDAPLSGLHPHTGMYNDSQDGTGPTGAGAVQCYLCHNANGATNGGTNYQGTYGSPTKLHVDGQTHFKFGTFSGVGYWANWETHMVHCQGKANWK